MKNKQISNKFITYIAILAVFFIAVAIIFTIMDKNKDKETVEIPNTPINIQTDLNFTVPGKTDEEVQAELNKELTEDEYNAFIDFIDKSQQDIIQLEDINNSDYVEYNEDGSITYMDSNGNLVTYNNQIEVPDNIFDMSLAEFVEYRETEEEVQAELNREMTDEEQERFISNLEYLQAQNPLHISPPLWGHYAHSHKKAFRKLNRLIETGGPFVRSPVYV